MHLAKNGVFPSPKLDLDRNDARHGSKITIQKKKDFGCLQYYLSHFGVPILIQSSYSMA